ncbi:transposase [Verticillium dahliae]
MLQPLDVGCFGPLKQAYGRQIEKKMRAGTSHITKEDFFPAFFAAFKEAMTEKNIQGGFRGARLVPMSPETVVSKLDVKLRTPTPVEGPPIHQHLGSPKRLTTLLKLALSQNSLKVESPDTKEALRRRFLTL